MIDSQPDLAPLIRRVRGGYLKIQGTWMPYEVSHYQATAVATANLRRGMFRSPSNYLVGSSKVAFADQIFTNF